MGGNVAMTIRLSDEMRKEGEQEIYKMDRWTNSFPWYLNHRGLVESSREHFDEYMSQWIEMKDDWDKNGPDGPFKHRMTSCYFPWDIMAPSEYGLIVVDYQTKTIISMQGYSHIGGLLRVNDIDEIENFKWFLKNGMVRLSDKGKIIKPINMTIEKLINLRDFRISILLDLSPWKVIDLGEKDCVNSLKFVEHIERLGIPFTDEDVKGWKEFVTEQHEYLEEDDELDDFGMADEWNKWFENKGLQTIK